MRWIKLKNREPDINIDGKKVLICRIVNESQAMQAIAIHDTHMVKYCNHDETWWMCLPELPSELVKKM